MIDWSPPLTLTVIAATLAVVTAVCFVLRLLMGPPQWTRRLWGVLAIRGLATAGLLALLLGPVHVDESAGPTTQPELMLLVDGSQSMGIGNEATRWSDAWEQLTEVDARLSERHRTGLPVYWFGHRLHPLGQLSGGGDPEGAPLTDGPPFGPDELDTDTRLADALKQLTSRFGRQKPAGAVVWSDGRARNSASVEEVAAHYAQLGIPLHVVPLGDTNRGGDVAIVSIVAPDRVRKYTDVDVQVFFRSFGYTGTRTSVELVSKDVVAGTEVEEVLASVPVTLRGGAQSANLSFRSDTRPRHVTIRIPTQQDEISSRNNVVETDISIDRTKIRVLYLEGTVRPVRTITTGQTVRYVGAHTPLQTALTGDDDVACIALVASPDWGGFRRLQDGTSTSTVAGFPKTMAELSAYDCVVLSSVAAGMLDDRQIEWLVRWVENRGGGLWMTGGPDSFRGGRWEETPIADVLPVLFEESRWQVAQPVQVDSTRLDDRHALFKILNHPEQNQAALQAMPAVDAYCSGITAKPAAEILAYALGEAPETDAAPLIVSGRYGRGRTLATSFPITEPYADAWLNDWQPGGNQYSAKLCRNAIYWLTEGSQIGRRRLVARVDKRFYRPGETVNLQATAYDETASKTTGYRVWGMIEPRTLDFDDEMLFAPVQWPNGVFRDGGEFGPQIMWGEEFELPRHPDTGAYQLPLDLAKRLSGQLSGQGLRIELTAYEESTGSFSFGRGTQVDSTSLELQILDDPFEQQNPFPNHDLLHQMAGTTGGKVLQSTEEIQSLIEERPIESGPKRITVMPAWSQWWIWGVLFGLLGVEWIVRRSMGMA